VVDACAGGGGKTLHLAAMMMNRGEVVALDVDEMRLKNLTERTRRAGAAIVRSTVIDRTAGLPADLAGRADAVLVDAPCSGVGTFRRNPAAKLTFTGDFVVAASRTQKNLLSTYAGLVRPGGRLVYSTCTLLRQENEDIVEGFVSEHPDFSFLSAPDLLRSRAVQVPGEGPFLTLFPHQTSTDGFFAAVLVRHESIR
jgi:16S rRNA (cytosine967-C5)-methyltransferase